MFFKRRKVWNMIRLSVFIFIGICIFISIHYSIRYKEGLELYEDHGNSEFDSKMKQKLKQEMDNGKGFNINEYKKKNPNDFFQGTNIKDGSIKYNNPINEDALKRQHIALTNDKNAQWEIYKLKSESLNKLAKIRTYFINVNKYIKYCIPKIEAVLVQMSILYSPSDQIQLYYDLIDIKPILNSIINNDYTSKTKITSETINKDVRFRDFINYITTNFTKEIKILQTKIDDYIKLIDGNVDNKVKDYVKKLEEINIHINQILDSVNKIQDIGKNIETLILERNAAGLHANINQYIDNEIIQPYKRSTFKKAKW